MELAEGAEKILRTCAGVAPGDRVAVIVDERGDPGLANALVRAAQDAGADARLERVPTTALSSDEAEEEDHFAADADILIGVTGVSIYHSATARRAAAAGARVLALTGASERSLREGAIEADFTQIAPLATALAALLSQGAQLTVESPGGLWLRAEIEGREGVPNTSLAARPGERTGCLDIEAFIAPIEGTAEGIVVVDASSSFYGLVDGPIVLEVEAGRIRSVAGGHQAKLLNTLLADQGEPVRVLAEFGFGLNPHARVVGDHIQDESTYGTGHVALGSNTSFGGNNRAPLHIDLVYWNPRLTIDDQLVLEDGVLVDPELRRLYGHALDI